MFIFSSPGDLVGEAWSLDLSLGVCILCSCTSFHVLGMDGRAASVPNDAEQKSRHAYRGSGSPPNWRPSEAPRQPPTAQGRLYNSAGASRRDPSFLHVSWVDRVPHFQRHCSQEVASQHHLYHRLNPLPILVCTALTSDGICRTNTFILWGRQVPMLNPDGVFLGNYRTAFCGLDLNRQVSAHSCTLFSFISLTSVPFILYITFPFLQPRACGRGHNQVGASLACKVVLVPFSLLWSSTYFTTLFSTTSRRHGALQKTCI
jgi:hypothetical protein